MTDTAKFLAGLTMLMSLLCLLGPAIAPDFVPWPIFIGVSVSGFASATLLWLIAEIAEHLNALRRALVGDNQDQNSVPASTFPIAEKIEKIDFTQIEQKPPEPATGKDLLGALMPLVYVIVSLLLLGLFVLFND